MSIKRKALLIQGAFGAVILTLLMQPMGDLGFSNYNWMLFVVLLLFFSMGADFKKIPSMIVCYPIGILWAMLNGVLIGALKELPPWTSGIGLTIVVIFCILTVHENLLRDTIFGNIPALFLGLAETFFIFSIHPANAPVITPFHLFGFFVYGMIMSVVLVVGGGMLCNIIIGKDWPKYVFDEQNKEKQEQSKEFLGLAETFFIFSIHPANAPVITPFHLFGFFVYGMIMSVVLVVGGGMLCNIIIGKDWPKYVFDEQNKEKQEQSKEG